MIIPISGLILQALLVGVIINHKLTFTKHIETIYKQVHKKNKALLRIRNYLTFDKALVLFQAYFIFFYNFPIWWMLFHRSSFNLLTLHGLGFLEKLRTGGGPSRPAVNILRWLNAFTFKLGMVLILNKSFQKIIHTKCLLPW